MRGIDNMTGKKNDTGKIRWELLSVDAMEEISKVLTFGAEKYEDNNWRKGFDWSRLIGAAYRHLSAWHNGQDTDPETGLSHLAHLGCCVMFLLEHEKQKLGRDDRYRPQPQTFIEKEEQNSKNREQNVKEWRVGFGAGKEEIYDMVEAYSQLNK